MDDRVIQAFYYAIGGVFLGIMIAIFWSFHISTQTSSVQIIFTTTVLSALCGFLFPDLVSSWFKAWWNFFS
ncbi:hypothetical protein [Acinetobacter sp. SFB]|uniref:hypothetical protein n=1 Tax=Acinetobacter sp. SFB TaxID=1805634 RepID=UPI0008300CCD|nr:hypothetical protein [Acinetobacter sp. SFB]